MEALAILALALAWDWLLGEPPSLLHPTVWMGWAIALWERPGPRRGRALPFLWGLGGTLATVALFALGAHFLLTYLRGAAIPLYVIVAAYLLKGSFSLRALRQAGRRVERALRGGDLGRAREELRALVGRDTAALGPPLLVSAAVESLAENTTDSFVAPLAFFLILGVPGAVAYRAINTLDASVGYRGQYEYLGKAAARLDDAANYLPARLAALLLVAAAYLTRLDAPGAWRTMRRDQGRTASPNGGWTMAAAAGALGVRLEKAGHYRLGEERLPLEARAIGQAVRLVQTAALAWFGLCFVILGVRYVLAA
ncbi:MAG: cobalamin biosynthesis protein [Chloroflexi bacterium]|nr:cobalamin biosynthesis protein [Chloroflexota bacterium]